MLHARREWYAKTMTPAELLNAHRGEILAIAERHGAKNVRVFGSIARGDADEVSDVDFLVDMERGRSLLDLGGLVVELRDLLGRDVDVVTTRGLKERDLERVADFIDRALLSKDDASGLKRLRDEVGAFAAKFPMPH